MAKSRGRKFAEITSPSSGVFDLTSVPTITNAKLQNSAMTLAGSSVSLGGTGVANTDALSEGSSNLYFTDARVQTFLGGGTLAGNIVVPDNRSIYVGSQSDFRIIHNTTNTQLTNTTGALQITSSGALALSGSYVAVTGAATFSSTITATGTITGTLATAAQPNITSLGTLTALTVDDITIDGSTISDAADLTFDVGGNIHLDADGGYIILKDGGTTFGALGLSGGNFRINADAVDQDIVFYGNDGGSGVTALTLDMSAAGAATFNAGVTAGGNLSVTGQGDFSTLIYVGNNNSHFSENNIRFQSAGAAYIDHNTTGQSIVFRTSNSSALDTTALIIDHLGNSTIRSGAKLILNRADNATGGEITYGPTGTGFIINDVNGDDTIFKTGSTEHMRIDAATSNVGIGIPPTKKLTVFGTGAGNATVQIEGEGGADPYINFLANNTQHWSVGIDDSDSDKFKISKHSALGTNDYFTINTAGATTLSSSGGSAGFLYLNYIRGISDGNTGVNIAGSDILELQTGGSPRLKIDGSGNVSMNAPSNLDVGGTGSGIAFMAANQIRVGGNNGTNMYTGYQLMLDRMNTPGDGPNLVLSRNGFFKGAIGGIQGQSGNATSAEGSLAFYTATTSAFNEKMRISLEGPILNNNSTTGTYAYNVIVNKAAGANDTSYNSNFSSAHTITSNISAPMEYFKTVALINTRAYHNYVNIKTNLTSNGIMFLGHFLGYMYGYGNKEAFVGGYTYQGNVISQYSNTTLQGTGTMSGTAYRASDGALCFKIHLGHTSYTEGQMIFRFHSHGETTTRQCTVVAAQVRNDGNNHY